MGVEKMYGNNRLILAEPMKTVDDAIPLWIEQLLLRLLNNFARETLHKIFLHLALYKYWHMLPWR